MCDLFSDPGARHRLHVVVALCLSGMLGCSDPVRPEPGVDAARLDGGVLDAGSSDAGSSDGGPSDGGTPDAGGDGGGSDGGCAPERCDGLDDDCDGRVDEEPTGCAAGERCEAAACAAPSWTWERSFGGSGAAAEDVGVDAAGNLYVAGWTDTAVTLAGTSIPAGAFLVSFDSGGVPRWARGFGGGSTSFAVAVTDRVYVLTETRFYGSNVVDFGGGSRSVPAGSSACHVAAFGTDGSYLDDREVSRGWILACRNLAARADRLVVTRSDAGADGQLLVLDRSLAERWRRALPVDARAGFTAADVAGDGSVIAGGYHEDAIDLGLGSLGATSPAAFVVAYDPTGEPRWQRPLDTERSEYTEAVVLRDAAHANAGAVVLLGGMGTEPADSVVLALDGTGAERVRHTLGPMFVQDLAIATDGRIGVVGERIGAIDHGGGVRPESTGFLVVLDAAGTYRWDVLAGRSAIGVAFDRATWWVTGSSGDGDALGWLASIAE